MARQARHWKAAAVSIAALGLALTACGGATVEDSSSDSGSSGDSGKCSTFNLAVNPWVGYEANAAVLAYVAEKDLGCKVTQKDLKEEIAWQGFGTGEVDAVVENWGHDDLKKKYITDQKTAIDSKPDRQRRPHRLVRTAVAGQGTPRHPRLEQPQQVRVRVQDLRVRRQGPTPRR